MRNIDSKKWFLMVLFNGVAVFLICGVCVFVLDPYFHYRKPNNGLVYCKVANDYVAERYINSGVIRSYEYDAVIAGTSMIENFKTSEFDSLYEVESVKLPISGGTFREVNKICEMALIEQPDMKIVFRSLDLSGIDVDKDLIRYDSYPEYLYNYNWLDDINYLLNKDVLLRGCVSNIIMSTIMQRESFNFDNYGNWNDAASFGREAVLSTYERPVKSEDVLLLSESEREVLRGNIKQNVVELAENYPDTRFILFFTPYSICYWDTLSQEGTVQKEIQMQEEVIEMLIPYDNIELYSFCNNDALVCNLDNYKDQGHYSEDVNSDILYWIAEGEYRITEDNYKAYLEDITNFYGNYDYDMIYRQ